MPNEKTDIYWKLKQQYYTRPDILFSLEDEINRLCEVTGFSFEWRVCVHWTFELLCFTLDTPQGRAMYLKLLNHIAPHCPDIAEKYWVVFDRQENMNRRYEPPSAL
ncbi:MAG: hypothetical protein LBJ72_12650 [Dysgonamonadaceae bacterium]|jgi:hypothetical protein|nr:hypothetical protein [Dysgonamonadaceae bacterium]